MGVGQVNSIFDNDDNEILAMIKLQHHRANKQTMIVEVVVTIRRKNILSRKVMMVVLMNIMKAMMIKELHQ